MKVILDQIDETPNKKKTKYKEWSFRFLIYTIIVNVFIFYLTINYITEFKQLLEGLNILLIISGATFTYLSYKNNEEKDMKYKSSIIGFAIFIILTVASLILYFKFDI